MNIIPVQKKYYTNCCECDKSIPDDGKDSENGAQVQLNQFDEFWLCYSCARVLESELTNFLNTR